MWRIGIAFLIGQCCIHSLGALPQWPLAAVLLVVAASAAYARAHVLVALILGIGWAWAHAELRLRDDLPPALEGRDLLLTGYVASIVRPSQTRRNVLFDFHVIHADERRVPSRLKLAWYDTDAHLCAGERWQLRVRLKRRNGFANPGGFDYEGHLFRNGFGATGYVRSDDRNVRLGGPRGRYPVLRARAWLAEHIALAVGETPMLGILQGLAVGDTQTMDAAQWRVFAATGTSHLMAISGLHVGMVAAFAALLGGFIVRLPCAQPLGWTAISGQAVAGMTAALGYSLLAGMSVPTQRTLVMLGIYFLVRWARRPLSIANALGGALLVVSLIDPFAVLSVGTWLSFGAVAVIVLANAGRVSPQGAIAAFVRTQWGVTIGLLPILIAAFGSVSLISPLANALAIPLFTFVLVPLILVGTGLAGVSLEWGGVLLGLAVKILELLWPVLEWLVQQPLAMWHLPKLPTAQWASAALGVLIMLLPGIWPLRLCGLALCLPAALFRPPVPAFGAFELTMLDVGQGLALVVRTRTHALVYDTGPAFRSGSDTGRLVLVPYLRSRGIRRIDRLIVSHGDLDHRGGLRSVLDQVATRTVLMGPSVEFDAPGERCLHGQRWSWDGVEFEVLHPAAWDVAHNDNDSSCVIRIEGRALSALLTGDVEAHGEQALLTRGLEPSDIVAVAHHGSLSSSTPAFVAASGARLALVSAGYRNRWGFPQPEIVRRWRAHGANVISTIDSGAIEVIASADGELAVRQYRRERRRYWASR